MKYVCSVCGAIQFVDSNADIVWTYCMRCKSIVEFRRCDIA